MLDEVLQTWRTHPLGEVVYLYLAARGLQGVQLIISDDHVGFGSGETKGFTGIDDTYEEPHHAKIRLDTIKYSPEENARSIVDYLLDTGLVVGQE